MIGKVVKHSAQRLGYTIVKTGHEFTGGFTKERIRLLGNPQTIVDVGVAGGTFELYDAFPDAHIVLVEPLPDLHDDAFEKIQKTYENVTVLPFAAGADASEKVIHVETRGFSKSSILERTELTKLSTGTEHRRISICRLDTLLSDSGVPAPFGIKIDTEGYDLNVVKGASGVYQSIDFIISEVSVAKRFEDSYTFAEFIEYMDSIDFEAIDLLAAGRDRNCTRFLDLAFKRKQ